MNPKATKSVLFVDDPDGVWEFHAAVLEHTLKDRYELRFHNCKLASEFTDLINQQTFDLVVINDSRVRWDIERDTSTRTGDVSFLAWLKTQTGRPILIVSSMLDAGRQEKFIHMGTEFLPMPCSEEEIKVFQDSCKRLLERIPAKVKKFSL